MFLFSRRVLTMSKPRNVSLRRERHYVLRSTENVSQSVTAITGQLAFVWHLESCFSYFIPFLRRVNYKVSDTSFEWSSVL